MLNTEAGARFLDPSLADALYGIGFHIVNPVTIGSGVGTPITVGVQIDFRAGSNVNIDVCNANGDCVNLSVAVQPNHSLNITYQGATDVTGNLYPSPNANPHSAPDWEFHDGSGAEHFAGWMRQQGIPLAIPGCGSRSTIQISCTYRANQLVGCRVDCIAF